MYTVYFISKLSVCDVLCTLVVLCINVYIRIYSICNVMYESVWSRGQVSGYPISSLLYSTKCDSFCVLFCTVHIIVYLMSGYGM